jgi:hypothetical protein
LAAYQQFKQGAPVCQAAFSVTPKIEFSEAKFFNAMHGDFKKSFGELDNGVKAYESGDFEKAGESIAMVFNNVMTHTTDKDIKAQKTLKLLQGVSNVIGFKFDLLDLLECIYEEDQAALALYVGVQAMEQAYADY